MQLSPRACPSAARFLRERKLNSPAKTIQRLGIGGGGASGQEVLLEGSF